MFKIITIFLLSFLLINTAYAAREVPGNVPDVRPLQPIPVGIAPNLEQNVNASADGAVEEETDEQQDDQVREEKQSGQNVNTGKNLAKQKSVSHFRWWLLALVLGAGLIWGYIVRKKRI